MIEDIILPPELITAIGSEPRDFAIKAKRSQPPKVSLALIIFGAVWLGFTSIFVIAFLGPLFQGKEVESIAPNPENGCAHALGSTSSGRWCTTYHVPSDCQG